MGGDAGIDRKYWRRWGDALPSGRSPGIRIGSPGRLRLASTPCARGISGEKLDTVAASVSVEFLFAGSPTSVAWETLPSGFGNAACDGDFVLDGVSSACGSCGGTGVTPGSGAVGSEGRSARGPLVGVRFFFLEVLDQ